MFRTTTSPLLVVMLMTSVIAAAAASAVMTPQQQNNVTANCGDSLTLQTLLTLVQHQAKTQEQQAAVLQTLQGQLTSLQSAVTDLKTASLRQSLDINQVKATATDVSKHVTERMDSFRARLQAKAERGQVAFTAHMSSTGVNVGNSGPFIFDAVTTNIGDAYNSNSGVFVAPYDGVYVFNFIMTNDGNAPTIHAQIEKDGQVLGVGTSDSIGENNKWDDGSALVTTRLTAGDHVYVKRRDGGTRVYGSVYTNFSGFLLAADA